MQSYSPPVDLLALIGADTRLRRIAGTRGGEWAGPCPQCGGRDRLHVQPEAGAWMCRQHHPRWSDAAGYLMDSLGLRYPEALARLENRPMETTTTTPRQPVERPETPPYLDWQDSAALIVERGVSLLWSAAGKRARQFLAQRGIKRATAEAARLGYYPAPQRADGLYVEAGITIPWYAAGVLWQVKIRRPQSVDGARYGSVAGGRPWLYGADTLADRRLVVLCEGEFDTLLLGQEAGDLAGVASLGSASAGFGARTAALLVGAERILVAYDADAAGDAGAEKLVRQSARCRRIVVPEGKDVTEFYQSGGRLRDWLAMEIARNAAPRAAPDDFPTNAEGTYLCLATGCGCEADAYDREGRPFCRTHWHQAEAAHDAAAQAVA